MTRHTGTVKWWNEAKGHGFITPDDGSADIYVLYTNVRPVGSWITLREGQRVTYSVGRGQKGPWAIGVVPEPMPRKRWPWVVAIAIAALAALIWRMVG